LRQRHGVGGASHLQDQAAFTHSGDVLLTADERYPVPCARQHSTIEALDGAGAHDPNLHRLAPSRLALGSACRSGVQFD
jgi:hypothetical protein